MSWLHSSGLFEKFNIVRMALENGVYLQWEQLHQHGKGMLVILGENGHVLNSSGTASSECYSFFRLLERFVVVVVVTAASVTSIRSA